MAYSRRSSSLDFSDWAFVRTSGGRSATDGAAPLPFRWRRSNFTAFFSFGSSSGASPPFGLVLDLGLGFGVGPSLDFNAPLDFDGSLDFSASLAAFRSSLTLAPAALVEASPSPSFSLPLVEGSSSPSTFGGFGSLANLIRFAWADSPRSIFTSPGQSNPNPDLLISIVISIFFSFLVTRSTSCMCVFPSSEYTITLSSKATQQSPFKRPKAVSTRRCMRESALGSILHTRFHSKCKNVGVKNAVWAFASLGVGTGQQYSSLSIHIRLKTEPSLH
mmetsp:Transcript_23075/g.50605  ORF Transcript_23075/g.50605 Transcript_23075/m.50605 type:complete len:275 (-) Transcript_23075:554-1378(-)